MESTDEQIRVHCPNCLNKRLFDCGATSKGIIKIKCPCCKVVAVINLNMYIKAIKKHDYQHTRKNL